MNTQEQHAHYNQQIEAILDRRDTLNAHPALDSYGMDAARDILSKLQRSIDAYGERAFGMSEKQIALVERAIAEENARLDAIEATLPKLVTPEWTAADDAKADEADDWWSNYFKNQPNPFDVS